MAGGAHHGKCPHVGVPTVMSTYRPLAKRGQMSPLAMRHRCLGGFPTHAVSHLSLLVLL
jgi:hypothetical protein